MMSKKFANEESAQPHKKTRRLRSKEVRELKRIWGDEAVRTPQRHVRFEQQKHQA